MDRFWTGEAEFACLTPPEPENNGPQMLPEPLLERVFEVLALVASTTIGPSCLRLAVMTGNGAEDLNSFVIVFVEPVVCAAFDDNDVIARVNVDVLTPNADG
jgi:hypothetical protein